METHICEKCGFTKSVYEFRRHYKEGPYKPWNLRMCKACTHAEYIQRKTNPEKYSNLKQTSRNWKQKNPEKHAALAIEYRKRHPEKIIAQNRLNYAIRKGRIKRQPCEKCGATERIHAHHVSYKPEDWYNVKWFCFVCHKLEHTT